jgi:glucose-6-phosphate isomerase
MITSEHFYPGTIGQSERQAAIEALKTEWQEDASGFYALPETQAPVLEAIEKMRPVADRCEAICVIGIGGSSLGPKAAEALLRHTPNRNDKQLLFFENGDPIELAALLKTIDPRKSLFIVTSKSGGTIETTSIFKLILAQLGKERVDSTLADRLLFITDPSSPLERLATENSLPVLNLPPSCGGRFSVLSAVGLAPFAFLGYNAAAFLEGAKAVRDELFESDPLGLVDQAYAYASGDCAINAIFAYASGFSEWVQWYVQLWGESLGKYTPEGKRVGLTPVGLIGSVDQHSFLQLIMEGPLDKSVSFIQLRDFESNLSIPAISLPHLEKNDYVNGQPFERLINAQCEATLEAVKSQAIPCERITIDRLDEWHVGALFMQYELLTALTGYFLGVNTYNQPGVELGKGILPEKFNTKGAK